MTFQTETAFKLRADRRALKHWSIMALLLLGALLLMSPFGWRQILLIRDSYTPELFILPAIAIFFAFWTRESIRLVQDGVFVSWTILCTTLLLFGILFHGDFVAAYSDFRCLIMCGAAFCIVRNYAGNLQFEKYLAYFLIFTLALTALSSFVLPAAEGTSKFAFPTLAFVAGIYVTGRRGWFALMMICFALGAFLAAISFYRQNYIVVVIALMMMVNYLLAVRLAGGRRPLFGIALFTSATIGLLAASSFIASTFSRYIHADDARYAQSVGKTTAFIDFLTGRGTLGDDTTRTDYFQFIGAHFVEFCLPGGLGQKVLVNQWRSFWMPENQTMLGSSLDGGHLFLAAHFGIFLTAAITLWMAREWLHNLMAENRKTTIAFWLMTLAIAIVFFLSSPFSQMSFAIAFGVAAAVLMRRLGVARRIDKDHGMPWNVRR